MDKYEVNHGAAEAHEIVLTLIKALVKGAKKDDGQYIMALTHIAHISSAALVAEY